MKNRFWLFQVPIILICASAYWVLDLGFQGELKNPFLQDKVYPSLQRVATFVSDWRFTLRGDLLQKNKIVIVEVDDESIDRLGRWPWHRNVIAQIIDNVMGSGAKVLGLDMVFSEPDHRIPEELKSYLVDKKMNV